MHGISPQSKQTPAPTKSKCAQSSADRACDFDDNVGNDIIMHICIQMSFLNLKKKKSQQSPATLAVYRVTNWPRVSAASNSNGNKQGLTVSDNDQNADSDIVSSLRSAVISHYGLLRILVQSSQSCSSKQFSHTHQFQDWFSLVICKRVMFSFTWEWWLTLHHLH